MYVYAYGTCVWIINLDYGCVWPMSKRQAGPSTGRGERGLARVRSGSVIVITSTDRVKLFANNLTNLTNCSSLVGRLSVLLGRSQERNFPLKGGSVAVTWCDRGK